MSEAAQSNLGAIRSQSSQSTGGCGCTGGGRRRKSHTGGAHTRRRRGSLSLRGGNYAASTDGKPAELPYAGASIAPATAVGDNGTFSSSGGKITASPFKGGRRLRRKGGSMVADAVLAGTVVTLAHYLSKKSKTRKGGRRYPRRRTQRFLV